MLVKDTRELSCACRIHVMAKLNSVQNINLFMANQTCGHYPNLRKSQTGTAKSVKRIIRHAKIRVA
jgi:hypothetical protein